jgi:iron complex transport system permease protein
MSATAVPVMGGVHVPGRMPARLALAGLGASLVFTLVAAACIGAFPISPAQTLAMLLEPLTSLNVDYSQQHQAVFWSIRLPRVLFGALVGAALALSGAVLQGLFRNPLADPTLIGVSSGAAFAAAATIVFGVTWWPEVFVAARGYALPLAAFTGGLLTTLLVYRLATAEGRTSLAVMLLAGIAITAMAMAGIGFFSYIATDEQLRNLSFWNLGSLAGANREVLAITGVVVGIAGAAVLKLAPVLNALALGEAAAGHLGVSVQRIKMIAIVCCAAAVGATVALTGLIGFVGLVAPHIVRLACGPDHRVLLPGAMLGGALLVVGADALARVIVAPAELPIGVICAIVGGPFFLALLYRVRGKGGF